MVGRISSSTRFAKRNNNNSTNFKRKNRKYQGDHDEELPASFNEDDDDDSTTNSIGRKIRRSVIMLCGPVLMSIICGASFRLGWMAQLYIMPVSSSDKESDNAFTLPTSRSSTTTTKNGNIYGANEDDHIDDATIQQIQLQRRDRRPYGRYCSTEVINEQQLWYGARKKVISISLFLDQTKKAAGTISKPFEAYLTGFKANVAGAALYYPDWIVRVFTFNLTPAQIEQLVAMDPKRVEVVVCDSTSPIGRSTYSMATSRLLAYDDPSVYVMVSRDSDGRFSPRELMAVNEWLGSEQCFHGMRDHKLHYGGTIIMAGMFGMKKGCLDDDVVATTTTTTTLTSLLDLDARDNPGDTKRKQGDWGYDQYFLREHIWPLVKEKMMEHDLIMENCVGPAVCRPFPLGPANPEKFSGYHVGQIFAWDNAKLDGYACTLECERGAEPTKGGP